MAEAKKQFSVDIAEWIQQAKGDVDAVIKKIALDLHTSLVLKTPVDTGRARANWFIATGSPNVSTTDSTDSSDIASSLLELDTQNEESIFITNSLPYIEPLEYGHSKQAPNGMVRLTVAEFAGVATGAVTLKDKGQAAFKLRRKSKTSRRK